MNRFKKIIFFVILLSWFLYLQADARAWWGGSSSWGWDAIGALIALLIYAIYEIRRRKMIEKAKKDLEKALSTDSTWNLEELKRVTENVFFKYQRAWSNKDLLPVKNLMTKSYFEKANKILANRLNKNNKLSFFKSYDSYKYKNILENIQIHDMTLMSVRDFPWKDWDMFAMEVSASMIDYTIDEETWKFIRSTLRRRKNESDKDYEARAKREAEPFKEYYIFIRYNWKWLLNNVKQQFSIVWDIIKLKESDLIKVLEKERASDDVNDDVFYN